MRDTFLPFSPPLIGEEEIAEVVDTLRSDWITTGPKVRRFEAEFAAAVAAPAALAVNSCTAAMHVALAALGVGPGDAVVTTPMTFVSSVHVIEQVGARPVLADVESDTLNIAPQRVAEAIVAARREGLRVKALLPVHLYGHPCDVNPLMDLAGEYDLAIVEDAAHALPAAHEGRPVGSFANLYPFPVLTCFSFYATKNLTTAEGGMLTGPPALIDEARIWSLHGMSRDAWDRYEAKGSWYYEVIRPGFKYNLTDIQAALGLHQLRKLGQFQARREEIVRQYAAGLSRFEELSLPAERPEVEHAWHLYVVRLNLERLRITRDQFIEELKERRIGTSVHFIPVHLHPYYRDKYGYRPEDFP
ncbi:MAG TPA: DegT/DnrJ/EryC1/StrS aminotransferase family protein, partial [Pyrinomonadaceae bacterium]|nr:DegT/DnrJ/EryC1/StrS aminotransferase family protein [Pyrinomonadaceae bacterium]